MEALISGVAARVVFLSGAEVSYIDAEQPTERHVSNRASLPYLLADAYDVELLSDATVEQAFDILLKKWSIDRSLRMLQVALDSEESAAMREEAASYLSSLIRPQGVRGGVENAAFSLALPESSDANELENLSWRDNDLSELLGKLISHQGEIVAVRRAWDSLPDQLFIGHQNRSRAELVAVSTGAFRELAEALKDLARLESAISNCYFKLKSQPNYREIVQQWTGNFANKNIRRRTKRNNEIYEKLTEEDESYISFLSTPIHEQFVNVSKQKRGIVEQLEKGNDSRARSFTEQLINSQLLNGKPEYAAKSLCSLAQEARRVGNTNLQLEWVHRATQIAPEDAWAHGQAGDVYFSVARFNEAYSEYEAASRWGMGRRGETGQAKVLAATGHLDDALKLCALVIAKYPNDPEAYSSRAQYSEILREMWRLEDALLSYEEAVEKYPDQRALRCGRAAVLSDMSRLTEALEAYNGVIRDFPGDVFAMTGRADVLKNLGELEASLDAYNEAIAQFPFEPVPLCGKAEVLRSMGRFDDAFATYRDAKERFPYHPGAFSGVAEVYNDLENFDAALAAYEEALKQFTHDRRVRNGHANTLRYAGRFHEALQEYERIVHQFPYDLVSLCARANMLKALGHYDDALRAYDAVLDQRPNYSYARHAKAAIYVIQSEFDKAIELIPDRIPRTSSDWVALHTRGMLHLRKEEFEAALDIFTKGVLGSPFHENRRYFENALAATKLRLGHFQEAINHIRHTDTVVSHLFMSHSYAALGNVEEARKELAAVNDNSLPSLIELRDEIAAQFRLVDHPPQRGRAWLLDRESEVLLQAA
ncbi:tetratricopeptide repeat protein [Methylocapsa acidiphila]|uniref:tetratricopeptide repeat protein n=1 Tax=Methylocapsa acidiphila TaxID=133552 RepID=UPI0004246371|nr:tetratricopeptide repeat protein [Methylocapsa acidiphila]